ncbi:hypothetical protein HY991_05640 [Candidatus Micrarchaeota archaeon]|nr:hypothetical protein [Candidatus Micrarchaeota archaeon]
MQTRIIPQVRNVHSGAQQQISVLARDQPKKEEERMSTFLPVEVKPEVPPNMRMWTRLKYLEEYFGFWKYGKICKPLSVVLGALGVVALGVFPLGGLIMLAVSGRLYSLAWWYDFIIYTFGKSRTLVIID